jgi:hypothetical protein
MTFNPAGTITLRPASADLYEAPQTAGLTSVTKDSELTLATLTVTGTTTANFLTGSTVTGITAHAGGGQADATVLTAANNYISVCATAADSVVLPSAAPVGAEVFVRNDGAKNAQVFAVTPGTINGVATGTGVALNAAASATYRQSVAGTWVT